MKREADPSTVTIDGNYGEGGGQIIRTSVALAAITGRPLEIANIRAKRSKPGLQAQHLTSVRAAAALCKAELYGDDLGSQFIRFVPASWIERTEFRFDVAEARSGASAGATGLVAQTLLVPLAFLPGQNTSVHILGGTHVPMAPAADYIEAVYIPALRRFGFTAKYSLLRAGFYPKGGGEIIIEVEGGKLTQPIDLTERGRLEELTVFIVTSGLPDHVAVRARDVFLKELKGYGVPIRCEVRDLPGNGAGAAVVLVARCSNGIGGWTALGERGKPMERVAEEAIRGFQKWFPTGAAVDEHLADQLALPAALTQGESRWMTPVVTEHLRTVLWTAQQFLPIEYTIDLQEEGNGLIMVRGSGR